MNLATLIEKNARLFPERPAVSVGKSCYATYGTFAKRVRAISYNLRNIRKLPSGSRIGLAMTNAPEFWEVLFGAWHAGMIAVPMNPKLHAREVDFILRHSRASVCFVTPDLAPALVPLADRLQMGGAIISVDSPEYLRMRAAPVPEIDVFDAKPTDTAWMFYTSGTTGRPKGALLSHRNLLAMILAYFADLDAVSATDCIVHGAPQSHGSGLWGLVHFAQGANNIVPESGGFDEAEIAALLGHYRGLSMFAAPTMVNRLIASPEFVSADLSNLKAIVYGGAPMYLADIRRALDVLGPRLAQIYGQGESPMTITGLPKSFHTASDHPRYLERLASVGYVRTGVEVRIVDDAGNRVPAGEVGEVVVRGDVVMSGYWEDEAATAKALRDGWLYTGDVGSFNRDGFLTLLDRTKDLIISGGSNIYPREVEEVLLTHPTVREVSVIGRPHADWGEEVVAVIVTAEGQTVSTDELDQLCLDNIARYKRPKSYVFLDALPKNSTGKVLKTRLRELCFQPQSGSVA